MDMGVVVVVVARNLGGLSVDLSLGGFCWGYDLRGWALQRWELYEDIVSVASGTRAHVMDACHRSLRSRSPCFHLLDSRCSKKHSHGSR